MLCIHYSKYRSQDWGTLLATDPTLPLTFGAPLVSAAHQAEHGTRIQGVPAAYNGMQGANISNSTNRTRVSLVLSQFTLLHYTPA